MGLKKGEASSIEMTLLILALAVADPLPLGEFSTTLTWTVENTFH